MNAKELFIYTKLSSTPNEWWYGLDLIDQSHGLLQRGTVYLTLARMEEKGLIESERVAIPEVVYGQVPRRRYRVRKITAKKWLDETPESKLAQVRAEAARHMKPRITFRDVNTIWMRRTIFKVTYPDGYIAWYLCSWKELAIEIEQYMRKLRMLYL